MVTTIIDNGELLNGTGSDIQDELNNDCVYHICSFFCGDLPMLSSLARVNTTFYAMTSSNFLWKPIAIRCFLFNPNEVSMIENDYHDNDFESECDKEETDDICYDFRSYISLPQHVKLTVLRERWMKQNRIDIDIECDKDEDNDELFEIFVRINPVYTDLHDNLYKLLYIDNGEDIDLFIDDEMYDLFRQLLEIFGTRSDFITISQIINNIKCLNYQQSQYRFSEMFQFNDKKEKVQDDLNKVIEIEYNNNDHDDDNILFIEIPLSQNCFNNKIIDTDDRHYLWIGKHICLFATFPVQCNRKLEF